MRELVRQNGPTTALQSLAHDQVVKSKAGKSLGFSPDVSLKFIDESVFVYHRKTDELYHLDEEANALFTREFSVEHLSKEMTTFLVREGIVVESGKISPLIIPSDLYPNLKYLLVNLTKRCNLRCKHCYHGDSLNSGKDLPLHDVERWLTEFVQNSGLVAVISGGEPMLYPAFWDLNDRILNFDCRFELLTNGRFINKSNVTRLNFHAYQVSVDGMRDSHDFFRGQGSFDYAIQAIELLKKANATVTVATSMHMRAKPDIPKLGDLVRSLEVDGWIMSNPLRVGYWEENADKLGLDVEESDNLFSTYAFGVPRHQKTDGLACDSNICSIDGDGRVYSCVLLNEKSMGSIDEDLARVWQRHPALQPGGGCTLCSQLQT